MNIESISPIEYFNINHVEEAFELMLKSKGMCRISPTELTSLQGANVKNVTGQIEYKDGLFQVKQENLLGFKIGDKYSPFMIFCMFRFKSNQVKAANYIAHEYQKIDLPYARIGIKYYKKTLKVDRYGIERSTMALWDKQTLMEDFDNNVIQSIEKYDDFTIEPDNKNYEPIINNNYNLYSPFEHSPCEDKDYDPLAWYWIETLMQHIFGDQYELGLKYIKVLYDSPRQPLPILVLISEERSTGKTTFVDFLNILFGANMVLINPQDISSQFNGSYADKNIIAIEESRFDSIQATEKLKNLATQKEILVNSKNVRQFSIPFYGKLIITSNDETKFSKVDTSEIRYWVRKVPTLKGKANHNILTDMKNEIPYFLNYLNTIDSVDLSKSRMVFTPEEIKTHELTEVKKESRSGLCKDLESYFDLHCLENPSIPEFKFSHIEVKEKFFSRTDKYEINYINKVIKEELKLDKAPMQRYVAFEAEDDSPMRKKSANRPFVLKNKYYGDIEESKGITESILKEKDAAYRAGVTG